jgi:hypothetical protein
MLRDEILESIVKYGKAEEIKLNINVDSILDKSSGSPRIQQTIRRKSVLILSQPLALSALSNLQIRCALCKRVISYPCWYYSVKYAVNHFHYFICFDSVSPSKPSLRCYRREE